MLYRSSQLPPKNAEITLLPGIIWSQYGMLGCTFNLLCVVEKWKLVNSALNFENGMWVGQLSSLLCVKMEYESVGSETHIPFTGNTLKFLMGIY